MERVKGIEPSSSAWKASGKRCIQCSVALTELEAPFVTVKIKSPGIKFEQGTDIEFGDLKFALPITEDASPYFGIC